MSITPRHFIRAGFNDKYKGNLSIDLYTTFIEESLREALPQDILDTLQYSSDPLQIQRAIARLKDQLPLIHASIPDSAPAVLGFTVLCSSYFTHGVGRYASDCFCRWLIPGKFYPLPSVHSLNFQFIADPQFHFFFHHVFLEIDDPKELEIAKNNIPPLFGEMRLNIMAVKHARNVMSLNKLSNEHKALIIQDNIASIIDRPSKDFDATLFDQMQHLFAKLSAENKIGQIKKTFEPYMEQKPAIFDRDIYSEIQYFVLLFRESFTVTRSIRHVGRIISYQYIFRKILQQLIKTTPKERHLMVKLLKTQLQYPKTIKSVVGILIGITVLTDHERFEKTHILTAIRHCLRGVKEIKDSYIIDQRNHDKKRLFYVEIEKEDNFAFSLDEMKLLRKRLARELRRQFENVINPVFMPRNDEEILRNVLLLSHQLKYVRDIPQLVISFDTQGDDDISFAIILLRLLSPKKENPLKEILLNAQTFLKFHDFEIKHVGYLRNKYIKEANIFKITLDKKPFLRKDYSLDLFKARQTVYSELSSVLGEMRDFNGGILSKQHEIFGELRNLLVEDGLNDDFLLESFFYSINPPLMRSIFSSSILKILFEMFLRCEKHNFKDELYTMTTAIEENYLLVMIGSPNGSFKDKVLASIATQKIPSSHLASTFVDVYDISCLGFIVRPSDDAGIEHFLEKTRDALAEWSASILEKV